jgi:5-formaminoimidazole-4-carboxamide-1-beta-D-ribofuranosyl 5'-monophosphate synthetase
MMGFEPQINFKSNQVDEAKEQIERQKMPKAGRGKKYFCMSPESEFWKKQERINAKAKKQAR